jgi:alpha-galactosidase
MSRDDCWSATTRDAQGNLQPDAKQFPSGLKSLADYIHSKGLYFGLYTCVGTETCHGGRPGSYGHYEQVVAAWYMCGTEI